jgi:hypothetical protein
MLLSTSSSLSILLLCGILFDTVSSTDLLPRADTPKKDPDPECTTTHPTTGEFYDLRPLIRRTSDKFPPTFFDFADVVETIGLLMDEIMDIISL